MIIRRLLLILLTPVLFCNAQQIRLTDNWYIKNSIEVKTEGNIVSTSAFQQENWYKTTIPSTVLNVFVKQGIYPDPRNAMNDFLIPDVSDEFNTKHDLAKYSYLKDKRNPWKDPYWYRTEVSLPSQYHGKQIWLTFNGINYRADVWLNGHRIADKQQMVGMFQRFRFNITRYAKAGEKNYLAVKIYQLDHPGVPNPGTQFEVFGKTRGSIPETFKDETLKMLGGGDCTPVIRDRNMGIYQDVFIEATGKVAIENPYVITTLPLPDTTRADIALRTELRNTSAKEIKGVLIAKIDLISDLVFPSYTKHLGGSMPTIVVRKEVSLKANQIREIQLSPQEYKALSVHNPYLWYPNGYGKQYLHKLKLSFEVAGDTSDVKDVTFGIRQITSDLKQIGNDYGRIFYINGKRIFCKGGWVQPDLLLDMNRKRVFDEARLMADANINILGCEDAPSPLEDVMESYDKYGLMYWEVFFQCWRMYPGWETAHNPTDHQLATQEVRDILKRYRNHPSIIAWFAANEVIVDEDLYGSTRKAVKELDETRPFIPTTSIDWDVDKLTPYMKADLPTGVTDDGAPDYNWNPQTYYFNKVEEVHKQLFRDELGAPAVPTYSSLMKFIPTVTQSQSQFKKNPVFPLDSLWAEHGAWDNPNYCFRNYDNAIRTLYGKPESAEQYANNAQYINADCYRAMFEAANHRMWDITSGVMIWKLNSCWPDVCWQIYDWYLNPNAAYYFTKKALEPVHIQLNANDRKLSVINATHQKLQNIVVCAKIIDFEMQTKWTYTDTLSMNTDCYKEWVTVPKVFPITPIYFVKLELKNQDGSLISDNLYWYCSQHEDFSALAISQKAPLTKDISIQETEKEYKITVKLRNTTPRLSFFNRLVVNKGNTKEEVLPSFWSDNFITLFPQEEKTVTAILAKEDLQGQKPIVTIE